MAKVNFIATKLAKYVALASKDASTLYFLEDANKIYKGEVDVTSALQVVDSFSEQPDDTIVEGKIYLNATTFEVRYRNGDAWGIMLPGIIATKDGFVDANSNKLATIGATKAYITAAIEEITGGTAFVKSVAWNAANGQLEVDNGGDAPETVALTGLVKTPTYDAANLTLTIPVIGGDDVVVNIPKDKFVTAGQYYESYPAENPEYEKVIVLTIDNQDEPVIIPAASLVDIYTADNEGKNLTVTITADNKISATLTLDPAAGNALTYDPAKGFMVDVSGKMDNYGAGTASELVISDAEGKTVSRTGVTLLTDEGTTNLGDSATQVPVASVIARAIAETSAALEILIGNKADKLAAGAADEVLTSTADGNYARSGKAIGGATLAETPDADTLATEAAVKTAIDAAAAVWGTLA